MPTELNLGTFTGNQTGTLMYWDGGYATIWFGWNANNQFGFGTCRIQYADHDNPAAAVNLFKNGVAVQASAPAQIVVFIPSGWIRAVLDGVIAGANLEVRAVPTNAGNLLFKDGKPAFLNGKPLIGDNTDCCCVEPTLCVEGCTTPDPETVSVTLDGVLTRPFYESFWGGINCQCPTYFNGITFVLPKVVGIACRWEESFPMSPVGNCVNEIQVIALLQSIAGVRQWSVTLGLRALTPIIAYPVTISKAWNLPAGDTCSDVFGPSNYDSLGRTGAWFPLDPCEFTNMTITLDTTP